MYVLPIVWVFRWCGIMRELFDFVWFFVKIQEKKLVSYFEKRMWVRLKPIKSETKTKYVVIMLHRKKFHYKIFDKGAHACINALKQHIPTQFLFLSTIEKQL